ncbi:MAG: ACT domain-containing protein [Bifidobacteriaceae bacterium]|jgi:hypothetical protein|nr:ACT domain-containing protein [Bifidobacteriaceae bacterium]
MFDVELELAPGQFTVAQVTSPAEAAALLSQRLAGPVFVAATGDEVSVVCPASATPGAALKREDGWSLLRVRGQLDFGLVGVLAKLTGALAGAGLPVFAVSTFDTDYLLVKTADLVRARQALAAAGVPSHDAVHAP